MCHLWKLTCSTCGRIWKDTFLGYPHEPRYQKALNISSSLLAQGKLFSYLSLDFIRRSQHIQQSCDSICRCSSMPKVAIYAILELWSNFENYESEMHVNNNYFLFIQGKGFWIVLCFRKRCVCVHTFSRHVTFLFYYVRGEGKHFISNSSMACSERSRIVI